MNADGTGPVNLTANPANPAGPDWAPITSTPSLCPRGTSPSVRCVRDKLGRLAMIGTALSETFVGTSGRDRISPLGGNDRVDAKAGDDRLNGVKGKDSISGRSGDDRLNAGSGRDRLYCGTGEDRALSTRRDRVARDCEQR